MLLCLLGFLSICCFRSSALGAVEGTELSGPAQSSAPAPISFLPPPLPAAFPGTVDFSPSCPEASFVSPSPGLPSALCSGRFHLLSAQTCLHLSQRSAYPWCQCCSVTEASDSLGPCHLRSAVARGPCPVLFCPSFRFWLVGLLFFFCNRCS